MNCPSCGSREIGCLPSSQFYCWHCFVQFSVGDNTAEVFEVEEDGTLVSLGTIALGQGRPVPVATAMARQASTRAWDGSPASGR